MRFLVYMYYTHSCYQTSIFGKNCAYYIRIFTVRPLTKFDGGLQLLHEAEDDSQVAGVYSDYSICEMKCSHHISTRYLNPRLMYISTSSILVQY